jgi:TRAP transporter 4TM/12TM fusion protein
MAILVKGLSAILPLYSIFFILNISGLYFQLTFYETAFRALFLSIALSLVFMLYPATTKSPRDRLPWYDLLLILIALLPTLYEVAISREIAWGIKSGATGFEQILFVVLLVVLFEGVRRVVGWPVLIIVLISFSYAKFAYLIPGLWGAPKFTFERLTEYMYLYDTGIFGMILGVGATIVILFNTFGVFLVSAGTSKLMMDGSMALVGRWRGGPAKVAIIGSAAMATMSGSPTANAGTTGAISIPLMKKLGYRSSFAAAVEAVASTGGLITPPVMGTIAFIMAEITGLGYSAVITAAMIPAILYYVCLYFQLDFEAIKLNLVGLPREQLPSFKKAMTDYWHCWSICSSPTPMSWKRWHSVRG